MPRSRRKPTRRAKLGLTLDAYDALLAAQGGGCAICGATPKARRLDTDHDHATGAIRGLLCHFCNRWLTTRATPERLEAAAAYLRKPPAPAALARHHGRPA